MHDRNSVIALVWHPNGGWAINRGDWGAEGAFETKEAALEAASVLMDRVATEATQNRAREQAMRKEYSTERIASAHLGHVSDFVGPVDEDPLN